MTRNGRACGVEDIRKSTLETRCRYYTWHSKGQLVIFN